MNFERVPTAVAFDLDDTLLHDDLSISDFTISTLRALHARGIRIIPASGRSQKSMMPLISQFGCYDLYIASNGGEIWEGGADRLLYQQLFPVETAREIAAFGKKHRCYMHTYEEDRFLFSEYSFWADKYASVSLLKGEYVGDLEQYIHTPVNKILFVDDAEKIARLLAEAQVLFQGRVSVTSSKANYLEFNPMDATKGNALRRAGQMLDIPPENFVAFGDSLNDLPMLEVAGHSVAVQNGRPEVHRRCDAVCASNNEDGVARYLWNMFLSGEEKP